MKGDTIIIKEEHHKKGLFIFGFIDSSYKIIAIGGESGTGKTEVATVLRDLLYRTGYKTKIISLDDYYVTMPKERGAIRLKSRYRNVGLKEIDWNFINSILERFLRNNKADIFSQRINKYTEARERVHWNSKDVDIVIVEGLYANNLKVPCMKFHLEGTKEDTQTFRLLRGKEKQGKGREKVLEKESLVVQKLKAKADYTVAFKVEDLK